MMTLSMNQDSKLTSADISGLSSADIFQRLNIDSNNSSTEMFKISEKMLMYHQYAPGEKLSDIV